MRKYNGLALAVLLAATSGCSDGDTPLRIQPFEQNRLELQVNQQHPHKIRLSRKVTEKTYVDLDFQNHSEYLEIPEFVKFDTGENLQTINVVGKAVTPQPKGEFMQLTFTLRDTDSTQDWSYRVAGTASPPPTPDTGTPPPPPPPDSGPEPDGETPPDSTPDLAPETGTPDIGSDSDA